MKNTRLLLVTAATLTVLATSVLAFAQSEATPWPANGIARRVIARVEARLNITPDQRTQAQAILKAEEPTIVALAAEARQERQAMTALPAYNEAEVRSIAEQYAATNTSIVIERTKVRLELRAVLTPQQLEQLDQLKSRMDGRFEEHFDTIIGQL